MGWFGIGGFSVWLVFALSLRSVDFTRFLHRRPAQLLGLVCSKKVLIWLANIKLANFSCKSTDDFLLNRSLLCNFVNKGSMVSGNEALIHANLGASKRFLL